MAGIVGTGFFAGLWVYAERFMDVDEPQGYRLWLPEADIRDPITGDFFAISMSEGTLADAPESFIHELTAKLGVTWSIAPSDSEAARSWYEAKYSSPIEDEREFTNQQLRELGR